MYRVPPTRPGGSGPTTAGRPLAREARAKSARGPIIWDSVWKNTIGEPLLSAYWKDAEFDARQRALYYVRAIEIPTPRWTAYDAKRFGVTMPPEVPMTVTERAYTSPIWYTPVLSRVEGPGK